MSTTVCAVDLGASSGRVMLGAVGPDELRLVEAHRFPTVRAPLPEGLQWDVVGLYAQVLDGLGRAKRMAGDPITSIGVDSWAVDYGVLDHNGALLGNPFHYRDSRTEGWADKVHARVAADRLYAVNGLQHLPFTTLYQLAAEIPDGRLAAAGSLLLVPDLLAYWLTGVQGTERTNASTTGLLDVRSGDWSDEVLGAVGVPRRLLPPLRQAGEVLGPLRPEVRAETGLSPDVLLTAVGSHDTASAVVGVPAAAGERFAYVCSGTWSLVGVELEAPVLTEESRAANFTNEGGVDGTVRYLRNVMGFWMVQESLRTWEREGLQPDLPLLLAQAAALPPGGPVLDADDPVFAAPGDMPSRIARACADTGQAVPQTPAGFLRCILESLAVAFARTVQDAVRLSGVDIDVVHVVGGGARNPLLCQLTADRCGRPVIAGPVEATSLGNVLVQARAHGAVSGGLADLRQLLVQTQELTRYEPGRPLA